MKWKNKTMNKRLITDRTKVRDFIKLLRTCNQNNHISLECRDNTVTDELELIQTQGSLVIVPYKSESE